MWQLKILKEIFEWIFGIKILKIVIWMTREIIRFITFAMISFHLILAIYFFIYPQPVYKELSFHKNETNNYFTYFLETSAANQLCYEWKTYKRAIIEKEEILSQLDQKVKKEQIQLQKFLSQRLQKTKANQKTEKDENNSQQHHKKQMEESEDISVKQIQYQNNIKKYQSEYEDYKIKVNQFEKEKRKQIRWQSWIEMDLICNMHFNQYVPDIDLKYNTDYLETSSIILELQILNLIKYPQKLKVIPLNILLIDQFNQKIPIKKDIFIQQTQSIIRTCLEKVFQAILQICFNFLGIEIEDDILVIRQEIDIVNNIQNQEMSSSIVGILISIQDSNNLIIIQQARVEVIPVLAGFKYFIFHHFYISFLALFFCFIVYLYLLNLMLYICNFRSKTKNN